MNKHVLTQVNNINDIRLKLEQVHVKLNEDRFNVEHTKEVHDWTEQLIQAIDLEEHILQQKSKLNWLKYGDGNTSYFHATIGGGNKQTGFYKLEDATVKTLTEPTEIKDEVIHFYENLMGKTTPRMKHVDIKMLR